MTRASMLVVGMTFVAAACGGGSADIAPVAETTAPPTTVAYERTTSLTRQASYIVTDTCLRTASEREAVAAWLRDQTNTHPPGVRDRAGWAAFATLEAAAVYEACRAQSWYDAAAAEERAARDLARVAVRDLLNDGAHHEFSWAVVPGLAADAAEWCAGLRSFPAAADAAGAGPVRSDLAATKIVVTDADDGGIYRFRLSAVATGDEMAAMWLVLAPDGVAAACATLYGGA